MSQFADSLHEVFAALGPVQIRRMFGGHGVFHDGLMCAIVIRDTLYLKCDPQTQPHFEALGLEPFSYERQGKRLPMSYRLAPETVFEDRADAALWSRRAFEAALRVANARPPAAPKRKAAAKKAPARTKAAAKDAARPAERTPARAPMRAPVKARRGKAA
ncbi:TfoX/Sxy family protein [Xenophilus sp. Marseille-Q4582]|uniref:TfoX/Sxy family protein n=1 Tax=Xenophilus sp. Marseille-Q4582 TaxID=2866600 RepID=UPI001CE48C81|nr:TfoX/Sxy family protein [Xenophilus sp. Marseille-Q4582]